MFVPAPGYAGRFDGLVNERKTSVVILGGGPGGYEAALVAAHLEATVTVVDRDGLGGAAVLTDCVLSKNPDLDLQLAVADRGGRRARCALRR